VAREAQSRSGVVLDAGDRLAELVERHRQNRLIIDVEASV
jgi:hypothetical protein